MDTIHPELIPGCDGRPITDGSAHEILARSIRIQGGFTMIEVLVALLILSIALVGLAMMQVTSLRYNHSALMRSQAITHAYEMADRVRANRAAGLAGSYNLAVGAAPALGAFPGADLNDWLLSLQTALPGGDGGVLVSAGPNPDLTITICWDDTRGDGTAGAPAACGGSMGFEFVTKL